ncbi:MAG: hypothetical protein ACXAAO_00595 [Candidatus Thorarchaeota archaeon]|jgi:uncharacterized protein (DUF2164 family)
MSEFEILKLLSVTLTRDKQVKLVEELQRYGKATNWTIKQILKQRLNSQTKTMEVLQDSFSEQFDRRRHYLRDVVKTARVEVSDHRKMSENIRGMRDKTPFFRPWRLILSQPLIRLSESAVTLIALDGTKIAIPFDKRSRNRLVEKIKAILQGEKSEGINRKYDRIRITWNKEGFADIDVRVKLSNSPRNNSA